MLGRFNGFYFLELIIYSFDKNVLKVDLLC